MWLGLKDKEEKEIIAKKRLLKKKQNGEERVYEYYSITITLYIRKNVIEKYGRRFVIISDKDEGTFIIKPKAKKDVIKNLQKIYIPP